MAFPSRGQLCWTAEQSTCIRMTSCWYTRHSFIMSNELFNVHSIQVETATGKLEYTPRSVILYSRETTKAGWRPGRENSKPQSYLYTKKFIWITFVLPASQGILLVNYFCTPSFVYFKLNLSVNTYRRSERQTVVFLHALRLAYPTTLLNLGSWGSPMALALARETKPASLYGGAYPLD